MGSRDCRPKRPAIRVELSKIAVKREGEERYRERELFHFNGGMFQIRPGILFCFSLALLDSLYGLSSATGFWGAAA